MFIGFFCYLFKGAKCLLAIVFPENIIVVSFSWNRSRNFGNFSKHPDFYLFLFLPPQRDKGEGRSEIGFGLWYDIKIYLKFEICFLLDEVNVQNSFSEMDSFILFCRLFFVNSCDQCISAIVMFNYSCIILYMFSKFILFFQPQFLLYCFSRANQFHLFMIEFCLLQFFVYYTKSFKNWNLIL